ncbi:MAG: hypothetical protein KAG53_03065 [Endozoicomonadaceae bacterium]|nr:hypothetical protein [Endozoicomonadaceae bacterium]
MKIIDGNVHCSFRVAYSFRIEVRQEHKNYRSHCFGRLIVAIKTFFSSKIIPTVDIINAEKGHENCFFAISLRNVLPVKTPNFMNVHTPKPMMQTDASKLNSECKETDPQILEDIDKVIDFEERSKNIQKKSTYTERYWTYYDNNPAPTMEVDIKKRLEYWANRRETIVSLLSLQMGQKLSENNPAIADLNNPNRAGKVAERFATLYENEWTYLLLKLNDSILGSTDESNATILLNILLNLRKMCLQNRDSSNEDKINLLRNQFKDQLSNTILESEDFTLYSNECINICNDMLDKKPTMEFGPPPKNGDGVDEFTHKPYTIAGPYVDRLIWPALYLYYDEAKNDGALITRGVVQCHS